MSESRPAWQPVGTHVVNAFLDDCGATGPLLLSPEGPGITAGERVQFHQPHVLVGSDPRADLSLAHPSVSRRHVYLQLVGGRLYVKNLQTRRGRRPEGPAAGSGWVARGDLIEVGPFGVRFLGGDDPAAAPGGALPPPTSRALVLPTAPEATLEFLDPDTPTPPWRVSRALVFIGRHEGCKIRLLGDEVSAYHCCLVRTTSGTWVVDLCSRARTYVNEAGVRVARLADGDVLRVGRHSMRVACAPAPAAPRPPALVDTSPLQVALPPGGGAPGRAGYGGLPGAADDVLRSVLSEVGQMQQQMGDQFQQALLTMFHAFNGMHQDQMRLIREELAQLLRQTAGGPQHQPLGAEPGPPSPLRLVSGPLAPPGPAQSRTPAAPPPGGPGMVRGDGSAASPPGNIDPDVHLQLAQRLEELRHVGQGRWQRLLNTLTGEGR